MAQKLHCTSCGQTVFHNEMKKVGEFRCTYCGQPASTNAAKREHQLAVQRQQIAKLFGKAGK